MAAQSTQAEKGTGRDRLWMGWKCRALHEQLNKTLQGPKGAQENHQQVLW